MNVACGGAHSCAVDADGRLYSWGLNDLGSLGWPPGTYGVEAEGTGAQAEGDMGVEAECVQNADLKALRTAPDEVKALDMKR